RWQQAPAWEDGSRGPARVEDAEVPGREVVVRVGGDGLDELDSGSAKVAALGGEDAKVVTGRRHEGDPLIQRDLDQCRRTVAIADQSGDPRRVQWVDRVQRVGGHRGLECVA